tara:strand:+ start:1012 stop:1332 length:321 start_codon:yes stop_codon:yes gene_type:complete
MGEHKYILVVKHGDLTTNIARTTAFGVFQTRADADAYRAMNYRRQNYICEILPMNDFDAITLSDSIETRAERLKQAKISEALAEMRDMGEEELSRQRQWDNLEDDR